MIPSIRILPGTLAYYLVLSIVPIITLIAIMCSKFSLSTEEISNFFNIILPSGVEEMLNSIFTSVDSDSISVWFIVIGFFVASNGAHSIILASNTLYKIKDKNYLERRIKSIFLTIVLIGLIIFVLVVLAFGNIILKFILSLKVLASVSNNIYLLYIILKWPVAIIVIFMLIKIIYTIAPDSHIPSKYVNKGSLFTTVGLILSSSIYSYYANNIANYSYLYGNLANIIVLMILFYVISYIIVLGIAINANVYELEKKD